MHCIFIVYEDVYVISIFKQSDYCCLTFDLYFSLPQLLILDEWAASLFEIEKVNTATILRVKRKSIKYTRSRRNEKGVQTQK